MSLDEATIESGCMSVIRGCPAGDVRPHRHIGDDPAARDLQTSPEPADAAQAAPSGSRARKPGRGSSR